MDKEKLIKILLKNVNVDGLVDDLASEILKPALQKVVDDTANPFDDMLMAAVYPSLMDGIKEYLKKKIAVLSA